MKSIRGTLLKTNDALQRRKEAAMPRGFANLHPVYADRALNSELWDVEGKRYIDFSSGIAVLNSGHLHPKVIAAVQRQLERFSHTCLQVVPYESAVELAERLNRAAPGPTPKKTLFVTTGAEAIENAVKIAKRSSGRTGVIAFSGGFHGRTHYGMALTGKVSPYKRGFGPLPFDVHHAAFPVPFHNVSTQDSLESIQALFQSAIEPERVAAIVVEPVQGEGGFNPAPIEFMRAIRKLCDDHGIVLICDEIQTGFGRTGTLFACQQFDIEPDIITIAKSLAGGFPLAAVCGKAEIMDAPDPGGLGGTYAGSPVAVCAALAILDVIEEENLLERSRRLGAQLVTRLEALVEKYPAFVGEVRGLGAMVAIELVSDGDSRKPNADLARLVLAASRKKGLLLLSCGLHGNVIRFLPPLTISDVLLGDGMSMLEGAFEEVLAQ
jgi:4-aminobutyrate aminotransferase/(S)-3-amino-2-methylpropionate transaminase